MLKVSDAFNSAFAAPDRELRARVTIGKTVYDSDDLTSINYDSGAMTGEQFSIGSTYMNSAKITFSHLVEGLKQLDEVLVEFGVLKPDGAVEYVKMGTFIVDDKIQMDRNNNTTTIECMDRMTMLGGAYVSKLTYPARIKDVAVEIANMAGVKANETSFARLSENKINQPTGYTYRDAIGLIAQFQMGFALFDRDGLLDIRTLVDSEFKIDPNQYFLKGLVKNETFFKLNGISCTVVTTSKDENGNETSKTTVLQSGSSSGTQIKLANNVMTQDVLDRMYEALKFTNYYPFSLNWNGNPAVEAGEWLTVEDLQGNEFKVPNMSYTLTYNGGLTATSKADTSVSSPATYSYGGTISNIVNEIGGREGAEGNHIYEGTEDQKPLFPKEGDLWYKHVGPDTEEWIYKDGKWEFLMSTKPATDAQKAADAAQKEAEEAKTQANESVAAANDAVAKAGFANDTADQAKSDAASALQKALDAYAHGDQIKTGLTADIDAVKGQVSLKANQVDVDKLGGRVTHTEAQIKLQADQIVLTVSKTELNNTLSSYATQTWTQSQIKTTADQINLSVSKVQGNLETLQISERNIALGTANLVHVDNAYSLVTPLSTGPVWLDFDYDTGDTTTEWRINLVLTKKDGTNEWHNLIAKGSANEGSDIQGVHGHYSALVNWPTNAVDMKSAYLNVNLTSGSGMITVNHLMLTRANRAPQKWQQAPEDAATEAQFSQLKVKVDGIQTTVSDKADKSQLTQLSGQITSVVEITDGITNANRNFVANSNFLDNANRWSFKEDAGLSYNTQSEPWIFGKKKALHIWGTPTTSFIGAWQVAPIPVASKGSIVYLSMLATKDGEPMSPIQTGLHFLDASGAVIDQVWHDFQMSEIPENSVAPARLVWKFIAPHAASSVALMIYGLSNQYVNFYVTDIKLEINSHTPWTPALEDETTRSQITQLANDINLRVEKDKVVNQINISPEGILIDGKKVHITGQTRIDNAVIKDAMIADIKADKITAGTLNAANVNVINLNANNITTGTIKGANLSLNLNTGEVLFQKGAIRSTNGKLNIDVNDGTLSIADSLNRGVIFRNGIMSLSDITYGSNVASKYGTVSFEESIIGSLGTGMKLSGAHGTLVGMPDYHPDSLFSPTLQFPTTGGVGISKNYLNVEAARIAALISGKSYLSVFVQESPTVQVGAALSYTAGEAWTLKTGSGPETESGSNVWANGKVIAMEASDSNTGSTGISVSDLSLAVDSRSGYVLSMSAYTRTYSSGKTATITPSGVLGTISSASKYKLAIGEISTINDEAHRFLSVKPKQWFDKTESDTVADMMTTGNDNYVDDAKTVAHTGFIAEDLYTAGLDSYVIRGNDGSLESIQYDRLPVLHHELIRELFNRLDAAEMEIYKLKQEVEHAS